MWGAFPVYFHYLRPAGAAEILAHRVIWSVVAIAAITTAVRRWPLVRALIRKPRTVAGIALAATLIAVNWFTYIYGVNTDRVIETSLGYFITPLISVLFGVSVFGERLRRAQWCALGIGTLAVAVITVDYGHLPWIALTLAVSFASYGLVKKRLGLPPTDALFVESSTLAVPALGYLTYLTLAGHSTFTSSGPGHTVLLVLSGVITAVPLLLFADAANRISMTGLGMLQYLAPILQLAAGVFILDEHMTSATVAGFGLVWIALAVFTWDTLHHARRTRATAGTEPATVEPAATEQATTEPATGGVRMERLAS